MSKATKPVVAFEVKYASAINLIAECVKTDDTAFALFETLDISTIESIADARAIVVCAVSQYYCVGVKILTTGKNVGQRGLDKDSNPEAYGAASASVTRWQRRLLARMEADVFTPVKTTEKPEAQIAVPEDVQALAARLVKLARAHAQDVKTLRKLCSLAVSNAM